MTPSSGDLLDPDTRVDRDPESVELKGMHAATLLTGWGRHSPAGFDHMNLMTLLGQELRQFQSNQLCADDDHLVPQRPGLGSILTANLIEPLKKSSAPNNMLGFIASHSWALKKTPVATTTVSGLISEIDWAVASWLSFDLDGECFDLALQRIEQDLIVRDDHGCVPKTPPSSPSFSSSVT